MLPLGYSEESPYWLNYPSSGGCQTPEFPPENPSWTYCPGLHRTRWKKGQVPKRKRSQFRRFHGYNNGTHEFSWEDKRNLHRRDNWHLCNAIASGLELTDAQKSRLHTYFASEKLNRRGLGLEFVVFVLASVICNQDGRKCYPHPNTRNYDSLFRSFAERHGFREKLVRRWFQRFQDQLGFDHLSEFKRMPPEPPRKAEWWTHTGDSEAAAGT